MTVFDTSFLRQTNTLANDENVRPTERQNQPFVCGARDGLQNIQARGSGGKRFSSTPKNYGCIDVDINSPLSGPIGTYHIHIFGFKQSTGIALLKRPTDDTCSVINYARMHSTSIAPACQCACANGRLQIRAFPSLLIPSDILWEATHCTRDSGSSYPVVSHVDQSRPDGSTNAEIIQRGELRGRKARWGTTTDLSLPQRVTRRLQPLLLLPAVSPQYPIHSASTPPWTFLQDEGTLRSTSTNMCGSKPSSFCSEPEAIMPLSE